MSRRAKRKGPFITNNAFQKLKDITKKQKIIKRNSDIVPSFVGVSFSVHNGRTFSKITVTEEMVGHKFGEFSTTRKKFSFKKIK